MEGKILILFNNLKDENLLRNVTVNDPTVELLPFETIDELPERYDKRIYSGILFLMAKPNNEILTFIQLLREKGNNQFIFILSSVYNREIFNAIARYDRCYIFEITDFKYDQIRNYIRQFHNLFDKISEGRKYKNEFYRFIEDSPANMLLIDSNANILNANEPFLCQFGYTIPQLIATNLNGFVPYYAYEEILKKIRTEIDKSKDLSTTFVDSQGHLVPVNIQVIKSVPNENEFYLYIINRSDVTSYRRTLEHQSRMIELIDELFNLVLKSDLSAIDQGDVLILLKKMYGCDFVIQCVNVNSDFRKKFIPDLENINSEKKYFISALQSVLELSLKKTDVSVLHFSPENSTHSEIVQFAQTVVVIPIIIEQKLNEVIILLYANKIEADDFLINMYQMLMNLLCFVHQQKKPVIKVSSETRNYKEIVENVLDGIYRSTPDGKILYANKAFIKLLEYSTLDELMKVNIAEDLYVELEDRKRFLNQISDENEVQNYVATLKTKKGRHITVLEHSRQVKANSTEYFIEGVIRDISHHKKLEDELKSHFSFSNEVIEKANTIIWATNKENTITIWNRKAEAILGYQKDELLNKDLFTVLFPDKNYRNYVVQLLDEHFDSSNNELIELNVSCKNGIKRILSTSTQKIDTKESGPISVFIAVDITKILVNEKRNYDNQSHESFSNIASVMADNFQKILNSIAESIKAQRQLLPNDKQTDPLNKQLDQVLRDGTQFLNKVIGLFKIKVSQKKEFKIDPNMAIEDAVMRVLKPIIPGDIEIQVNTNSRGMINLEEAQFNQLLLNLAHNSVAAMPDGGLISISTQNCIAQNDPFLISQNAMMDNYIKFSFTDTGKGMSDQTKARVFEPFFTTSSSSQNHGLGATLIYNIIRRNNGYIDVASDPGKGTCINFYFPFIVSKEKADDKNITKTPSKKSKILVVDDQKVILDLIRDIAGTVGYSTILAEDGEKGFEIFKQNYKEIDLAILDIIMPNLDGRELYLKIKKIKPEIKVLITSGYSKGEIKQELIEKGVDGFLPKPFDIKSVREQIQLLLS